MPETKITIELLYVEIQKILEKLEILKEALDEIREKEYVPNPYFGPPDNLW